MVGVTGSIPVAPTIYTDDLPAAAAALSKSAAAQLPAWTHITRGVWQLDQRSSVVGKLINRGAQVGRPVDMDRIFFQFDFFNGEGLASTVSEMDR